MSKKLQPNHVRLSFELNLNDVPGMSLESKDVVEDSLFNLSKWLYNAHADSNGDDSSLVEQIFNNYVVEGRLKDNTRFVFNYNQQNGHQSLNYFSKEYKSIKTFNAMCAYVEDQREKFFAEIQRRGFIHATSLIAMTFMIQNPMTECFYHYYDRRYYKIRWNEDTMRFEEFHYGTQWQSIDMMNGGETFYIPSNKAIISL